MAHTNSYNITVVDVYDIAADIGKHFETLIDRNGPDTVAELMPKVITVLEHLETLANKNQKENTEIAELKFAVERLQAEKTARAEERARYEQELEQIEDSWRTETRELVDMVNRLQDENRKLNSEVKEKQGAEVRKQFEEDMAVIEKLKDTVEKQRDQLRALKREVSQRTVDAEALQAQLERMAKLNTDYRRKNTLSQRHAQGLIQEKADLEAQLHDKEQYINQMKEHLRDSDSPHSSVSDSDYEKYEEKLNKEGKMIVDMSDPNRPRFTLNELRDVLQERNELKTRLYAVEEELHLYKPDQAPDSDQEFDYDAPVHGPINKEPDEKLHPEKYESGIRKFFSKLFGSSKSHQRKGSNGSRKGTPPPVVKAKRPVDPSQGVQQFFNNSPNSGLV